VILTRALAYDGNLRARAAGTARVAVLAKGGNTGSQQVADDLLQAFEALDGVRVQGLPIKALKLEYNNPAALGSAAKGQNVVAIYICPGLDKDLAAILGITRAQKMISIAGHESYIEKGASVGVFTSDGKPTIFVNLSSSKGEGTDFSSDLLRLAKVFR
jgi:hypothetical protein